MRYLWINIIIIICLIAEIIQNVIENRKLIKIEKRLTELEKQVKE
jgi:hypothetical protein